jgi:GT2 family glycosyltransferase
MSARSFRPSIIIPTKNRVAILVQLLESIRRLDGVNWVQPEVIVADNGSMDNTYDVVHRTAKDFPTTLRVIQVTRAGKSAAVNDALKTSTGDLIAFLDDDVAVDRNWLAAVEDFFRNGRCQAGQGVIRLPSPEKDDPEILRLVERYRTIPRLEYETDLKSVRSLNGANFFVTRGVFDLIGGFDERLGPGVSGTSEDVDFARRLIKAGITIGYSPEAIVYHRVDRARLTEEYFKQSHQRQGASRFLLRNQSGATIAFSLFRAAAQYGYYTATGKERHRYRSKGRIYHYLGMMEAKQNHRR